MRRSDVLVLAHTYRCDPRFLISLHRVEDAVILEPQTWGPGDLPRLLRAFRRWNDHTQARLAALLGLARDTVRAWERGSSNPTTATRRRLEALWRLDEGCLDRCLAGRVRKGVM